MPKGIDWEGQYFDLQARYEQLKRDYLMLQRTPPLSSTAAEHVVDAIDMSSAHQRCRICELLTQRGTCRRCDRLIAPGAEVASSPRAKRSRFGIRKASKRK